MHYSYEHMRKNSIRDQKVAEEALNQLVEEGNKMQSTVEYCAMLNGLEQLSGWCGKKGKMDFFTYFQDALISAFCSYIRSKDKNWSKKRDMIALLCKGCLAAVAAIGTPVLIAVVSGLLMGELTLPENKTYLVIGGIVSGVLLVIALAMFIYHEKYKKANYEETWVRHSLRHARLQLVMNEFLVSDRTEKDYQKLVDNTFSVLGQNLDQFAVNMCPKGVASRGKKSDK